MQTIQLAHGSGGAQSQKLTQEVFNQFLGEFFINHAEDAGIFQANGKYASSTDSYVVSPLFFPGGDIGKLSICGSCNDVLMMGAIPKFINLGFILEEGLEIKTLQKILKSMALELKKADLKILSADTKVVGKGSVDKIFINSTAIGEVIKESRLQALQENDAIIISGNIGAHGGVIFCARNEINLTSNLTSDCKQLYPMLKNLLESNLPIHTMRDATRGGLASVLNEWAQAGEVDLIIEEEKINISNEVQGICEILGLEAYALANEGACVLAVPQEVAQQVLQILQSHPDGKQANIIGNVCKKSSNIPRVILKNAWGSKRFLDYPQGELLPRIC